MKAVYANSIIAESDATVVIENNHYFPPDSVRTDLLRANGDAYECPWKGHADYYDVVVGDRIARGGAWMYPEPKAAAAEIAGHFAFWRDVRVTE